MTSSQHKHDVFRFLSAPRSYFCRFEASKARGTGLGRVEHSFIVTRNRLSLKRLRDPSFCGRLKGPVPHLSLHSSKLISNLKSGTKSGTISAENYTKSRCRRLESTKSTWNVPLFADAETLMTSFSNSPGGFRALCQDVPADGWQRARQLVSRGRFFSPPSA
jgi:hypothetical protein